MELTCPLVTRRNGAKDAEPCVAVLAFCPIGDGYTLTDSPSANSACHGCTGGYHKSTGDNSACVAHTITACEAGEQLTPGIPSNDGSCHPCPGDTFKAGHGR